jgi:hypothetical protein
MLIMNTLKIFLILMISLIIGTANVYALNLGSNITVDDNRSGTWNGNDGRAYGGAGWWTRTTEDQEVEPGMIPTQVWDLEGFFLKDGRYLSMVGGFDFKNGVRDGGHTITSGDIFFDTNGNAQYGSSADRNVLNNGYDYVVHFTSWIDRTYDVYQLTANSILEDVLWYNAPYSNPWRYGGHRGTVADRKVATGSFIYESGLTDDDTGFLGGSHYAVEGIDLSFLPAGNFIAHFTMECGNDNLMDDGQNQVPEPATMLLLGLGLMGLAGVRSKFGN